MDYIRIEPREWASFFERVTGFLEGREVQIEVAGLDIGDQIQTHWVPLTGISYDNRSDQVGVFTPELQHNIPHPRRIHLQEKDGEIAQVIVVDQEGRNQFVQFRYPLELARSGW